MSIPVIPAILLGLIVVAVIIFRRSLDRNDHPSIQNVSLRETEYQPFKLIEKKKVNQNSIKFRFELPSPSAVLGLPVGKHLFLRFTDKDGKVVSRAYTPVSSDMDMGYFDLLIKIYPTGKMGPYLESLPIGSMVDVKGPMGELEYRMHGEFNIKRKNAEGKIEWKTEQYQRVIMIAGGSGITPMFQIIRAIGEPPAEKTPVHLLYANVTEQDILLRQEIEDFVNEKPNIKCTYTLDKPAENWKGEKGFVTADMLEKVFGAPTKGTLVLMCGPKPMLDFVEKNLKGLDYQDNQIFKF